MSHVMPNTDKLDVTVKVQYVSVQFSQLLYQPDLVWSDTSSCHMHVYRMKNHTSTNTVQDTHSQAPYASNASTCKH